MSGSATFLFETRGWQLSSKGAAGFYKQQLFLMMPARRRDQMPQASYGEPVTLSHQYHDECDESKKLKLSI